MKPIKTKPRGFEELVINAPASAEEFDSFGEAGSCLAAAVSQVVANVILKAWRPKLEERYFELTEERPYISESKTQAAYEEALNTATTKEEKKEVEKAYQEGKFNVRIETDTNFLARVTAEVDPDGAIAQEVLNEIGWIIATPRTPAAEKPVAASYVKLAQQVIDGGNAAVVATNLSDLLKREIALDGENDLQILARALSDQAAAQRAEDKRKAEEARKALGIPV